jgi:hypothetical protein
MADFPQLYEQNYPGRILARSGVSTDFTLPGANIALGELVVSTDKWYGYLGDKSQNPPKWPTSKSTGDFDWTGINPSYNNINVVTINGKTIKDLINENINNNSDGLKQTIINYINNGELPVLTIVNDIITKTVYGSGADFASLKEAYDWLSQRTISKRGFVTLAFPAGVISETQTLNISHPNGDRIAWQGAALKAAIPSYSVFNITGYSLASAVSDTNTNVGLLKQSFSTEIHFTNGGSITVGQGLSLISNILFTSDGAVGPNPEVSGFNCNTAQVVFSDVGITGFDRFGIFAAASSLSISKGRSLVIIGCGGGGYNAVSSSSLNITYGSFICLSNGVKHASDYGTAGTALNNSTVNSYPAYNDSTPSNFYMAGNVGTGLSVNLSSSISGTMNLLIQYNGGNGVDVASSSTYKVANGVIRGNAGQGIGCIEFSLVSMLNSTVTNNGSFNVVAINASYIFRAGSTVSGAGNGVDYSPAVGQQGNTFSYIG